MKFKNDKSGITLVALIVTIVILLILAGISISALTQTNLFIKAKLSKEKHESAQIEENETLANYENNINKYINSSSRLTSQSNYRKTLLWAGDVDSGNITYIDNHTSDEFDSILFFYAENGGLYMQNSEYPIEQINLAISDNISIGLYGYYQNHINLTNFSKTGFNIPSSRGYRLQKVYGINY